MSSKIEQIITDVNRLIIVKEKLATIQQKISLDDCRVQVNNSEIFYVDSIEMKKIIKSRYTKLQDQINKKISELIRETENGN